MLSAYELSGKQRPRNSPLYRALRVLWLFQALFACGISRLVCYHRYSFCGRNYLFVRDNYLSSRCNRFGAECNSRRCYFSFFWASSRFSRRSLIALMTKNGATKTTKNARVKMTIEVSMAVLVLEWIICFSYALCGIRFRCRMYLLRHTPCALYHRWWHNLNRLTVQAHGCGSVPPNDYQNPWKG